MTERWEYSSVVIDTGKSNTVKIAGEKVYRFPQMEIVLNSPGAEGWEVVGVSQSLGYNPTFILKRPR